MLQNWNEESRQARNINEITEIEEFYRPYMDQYNNRQKELERLMRLYSEYCTSEVLSETTPQGLKREQQESSSPFQVQPDPREKIPTQTFKERGQVNQPLEIEETCVKGDMGIQPTSVMSSIPSGIGSRSSSLPTNTRPCGFQSNPVDTATEGIESMNILPQRRMSTLSSVVSPMPTTATRTIAITREESRQDALETVRQMIGSTPSSTVLPMSTNTSVTHEPCVNSSNNVNTPVNEVGPRVTGPYLDSGMTDTTAPMGMATPIAPDLIWPGHPNLQGTNLFPRDDDPTTISAGGLDPEERWKIHHPYDIPGVRRPTMDTPDNLRRLAESEALVESLQTMEYLTEFPTLEERRDFWCFPPRFGDPHYHPSRLKKHDDGRSRRRPDDERPLTFGSSSDREPRHNTLGTGRFMSPMRRIAEAVQRVPSVQDVDIITTMENTPEIPVNNQWDDGIDVTPELDTRMDNRMPSTVNYSSLERENVSVEPIIVSEHALLLNGGPSSSQQDVVNPTTTTETIASRSTPTEPVPAEIVSRPPTLPETSTNTTERAPLTEPICLMTEDPQIRCTVCNTVDCMIHNLRH